MCVALRRQTSPGLCHQIDQYTPLISRYCTNFSWTNSESFCAWVYTYGPNGPWIRWGLESFIRSQRGNTLRGCGLRLAHFAQWSHPVLAPIIVNDMMQPITRSNNIDVQIHTAHPPNK